MKTILFLILVACASHARAQSATNLARAILAGGNQATNRIQTVLTNVVEHSVGGLQGFATSADGAIAVTHGFVGQMRPAPPVLARPVVVGTNLDLVFFGEDEVTYQVETSTNLIHWATNAANLHTANGVARVILPARASRTGRFYRVIGFD